MFEQAYGAALVIVVASVVLGHAICAICGGAGRWRGAPLVGFATLMVLADAAIELPGRAVTALVVCALACIVAAVYLGIRGRRNPVGPGGAWRTARAPLIVAAVALFGASIPYLAAGRVGPGAGIDNDMAIHLLVAEALRSAKMAAIWNVLSSGYPTGPHSVVAMVGTAIGAPLIMVFSGLMIAVIVLTALAGADLLPAESLWRRVVIGVLCALTYLVAGFYGEGAFKEMIMAGLLLGFVLTLEQLHAGWSEATETRRFLLTLPAGLLAAGAIYVYSYLGIAWFAATTVVWLVAEGALAPRRVRGLISLDNALVVTPWVGGFLLLGVLVLIPIAGDVSTFFSSIGVSPAASASFNTGNVGNLIHPLPFIEGFGVWFSPDFRMAPSNPLHAGEWGALAALAVAFGLVRAVRRRDLVLAAGVIAAGLIWAYSQHSQSSYVAAKALVIWSPLAMGCALRELLPCWRGPRSSRSLALASAAVLCIAAAYSSYQALRSEPVQAPEAGRELAGFHHITGDAPVVFLGVDDWAPWQLRDSPVATLSIPTESVGGIASPPNKPFAGSQGLDFDSVIPHYLNNFPYVITTTTAFASQAPANFHLVAQRRLYELWRRSGPTPPRESIEGPGNPGAVLDCKTPTGRQIVASGGIASLMAQPAVHAGVFLAPGHSGDVSLALPSGRWEISAQYTSTVGLSFSAQGVRYSLPAYLGRVGGYFNVGAVTGAGAGAPVTVHISADRPSPLTGNMAYADVYTLAATRIPDARQLVPIKRACGHYVDWFRHG
jgi:hypothetical protein